MITNLKSSSLVIATACIFMASLSSCRKNADEVKEIITESEAAEIVEAAVSERTAGAALSTEEMARMAGSTLDQCNQPGDTSFAFSNDYAGASYAYQLGLDWLLSCSDLDVPQQLQFDMTGSGTFASVKWDGTQSSTGTLLLTGLDFQSAAYTLNGDYDYVGEITGDLRLVDPSLDCTIEINLVDLQLDKDTYDITTGSGSIVLTVSNGRGQTQTLNGQLVFNGDGTATVTINNLSYTFDL
ncbi:MAG: hypothetical protein R2792_07325 [Saprospiraceae bacterium]